MLKFLIFGFITLTAGLLLANIYSSLVDAPAWDADIPASVQAAREHYKNHNPGDFFRIFSPVNQLLGFLTVVFFWNTSRHARLFFGLAFLLAISADIMTFTYFYPRNTIIFESSLTDNLENIRAASAQWLTMNWVRSLIVALALCFAFLGLNEVYKKEFVPKLDM